MATKTGYFNAALSDQGKPIQAMITIYVAGTSTKPTIWSDAGGITIKDNPFITDVLGRFQFFTNPGFYDIEISGTGITILKIESIYISSVISMERLYNLESILQEGMKMGAGEDFGKVPWADLGQQFSQAYIYSLAYLGNGIALAGTGTGGRILRSTDYGATWANLGQQFSQTSILSLAYLGNGIALAGTGDTTGKILRSTDYGATWADLGQQFSQTSIRSFAYLGNGIALAGTDGTGKILRHQNWMLGSDHNLLSARHLDTTAASPVLGDIVIGDATPRWKRTGGNITTTRKFLRQVGTGSVSAEPGWDTLQVGDLPAHAWGNLIYVAPGTNTLSTALAAISDGDVLLLGKGTYIQTAALTVPAAVTDFAIIGAGMCSTLIRFDADVEGITQTAVRVHHCILRGFRMVMNVTSTTRKAICLWGATHNTTVNPCIHIDGISIERGADGKRWGRGVNLLNAFESLIENIYFRGNPYDGSGVAGDAIYLESCVCARVLSGHLCEANNAISLVKADDAWIEGATKHGCEACTVQNIDIYICNRGAYLGEKALDNRILDCNAEPVYINVIEEGAYSVSCGYNYYRKIWAGWKSGTSTHSHLFWLRMPGGKIADCILNGENAVQNLITLTDDRDYISITGCLLRNCQDGAYPINMASVNYSIIASNIAENSGEDDDVLIAAGSDNNRLVGNIFPKGILNNGTGNDIV